MTYFNTITFRGEEIKHQVSFIIPVYKDYNGLRRTLRSIKQQKVTDHTIEIIVVNDGGSEKIKEVCIREKVKMVDVIPNSGSYYARNRGLEYSTGEFIALASAALMCRTFFERGVKGGSPAVFSVGPLSTIFSISYRTPSIEMFIC